MTALDGRWLANEGLGAGAVAGVIGLAGPYDFYPFTSEGSRNSFGHVADAGTTQPVNFANSGAPPMLLLHGETDTTVRVRNSRALADALGDRKRVGEGKGGSVRVDLGGARIIKK